MRGLAWKGALAVWLLLAAGCRSEWITGPEYQIRELLKEEGTVTGPDTRLSLRYLGNTVELLAADQAVAYAQVRAQGRYQGVTTRCICTERVPLRRDDAGWRTDGFPLPRLAEVVAVLEAREAALTLGRPEAWLALVHPDYDDDGVTRADLARRAPAALAGGRARSYEVVERILRVDRHEAVVTETWRLTDPERPDDPPQEGRSRFRLTPDDGQWRFVGGLM